jgi:tetratricopeptide (TPR) repeat protein
MERGDLAPRRIETVQDVAAVLDSPAASFTELMECVSVAKAAGEWELRHRAAERAFSETRLEAPAAVTNLSSAAEVVIDNYFKVASSLDDLPRRVKAAEGWLHANRSRLDAVGASDFADEQTQLLAELQVLLSDTEPAARVRLCARLRKVDRSDLGIESVRPVANNERDNIPALTTLGAAYCDMGEFERAERVLRAALKVQPADGRARVALSRVLQESGRQYEAFDIAKVAFVAEANKYTAHRLLAAAAAVGDTEAFDQAVAEVERAADSEVEGPPDVYLLLLAAEALIVQGRVGEVTDIVARIASSGVSLVGATAKRFATVKKSAQAANAPSLFEDPPPS